MTIRTDNFILLGLDHMLPERTPVENSFKIPKGDFSFRLNFFPFGEDPLDLHQSIPFSPEKSPSPPFADAVQEG